jgi:hypothetical protein
MASDNGSGGINLPGLAAAASIVAVFAYFLIGDRLGLRDPPPSGDVRVEAARLIDPPPDDQQPGPRK